MKDNVRESCINIIDKLTLHPISKLIVLPSDIPKEDNMTLEIIKNNLIEKNYRSVREFKKDMNYLIDYFTDIYGGNTFYSLSANYFRDLFEKELRKYVSTAGYFNKIEQYKNKINELTGNPPSIYKEYVPITMLEPKDDQPFNHSYIQSVYDDFNRMTDPSKKEICKRLLNKPKSAIDIVYLPTDTLIEVAKIIYE